MLPQPRHNLVFLFNQSGFRRRVENRITRAGVACDDVFAFVQIGNERHDDFAAFGSAFDEIFFLVIQVIEQRPGYGFQNRSFAGAVLPANGYDAGLKIELGCGVILDVLKFDFGD